jgi:hypothetical protein
MNLIATYELDEKGMENCFYTVIVTRFVALF